MKKPLKKRQNNGNSKSFVVGNPGNPNGRGLNTPNKITSEIRRIVAENQTEYLTSLFKASRKELENHMAHLEGDDSVTRKSGDVEVEVMRVSQLGATMLCERLINKCLPQLKDVNVRVSLFASFNTWTREEKRRYVQVGEIPQNGVNGANHD